MADQQVMKFTVGDWRVSQVDSRKYRGQTTGGVLDAGAARVFVVEGSVGSGLVAYVEWSKGARDVRCLNFEGPPVLRRLEHGLRIGVSRHRGGDLAELALAKPTQAGQWANVFKATEDEISEAACVDLRAVLIARGCTGINTKERLVGDTGRRRSYLAAIFPPGSVEVPVAAYMITRVLPLAQLA